MDNERNKRSVDCVAFDSDLDEYLTVYADHDITLYGSDGTEYVDSPAHYNVGSIEAIDAIESSMNFEETVGYLKGSTLKYLFRYRYKGKSLEDLKKARWYLNRLISKWET